MPNYAVLDNNNIVINRIVADSIEDAQEATGLVCILCDGTSRIDYTWNGTEFVKPVIEELVVEEPEVE